MHYLQQLQPLVSLCGLVLFCSISLELYLYRLLKLPHPSSFSDSDRMVILLKFTDL